MSNKYAAILRPMSDVRCYLLPRITEDGDCWIWKLHLDVDGQPKATIGRTYSVNVRRWVLMCRMGGLDGLVASTTCGVRGCVNPKHLVATTIREAIKAAAKRGAHSSPEAIANRTVARRKTAKLSGRKEEILSLRNQGLSYRAIAERIGCNQSAIGHICRGRYHQPIVSGASVFTWRPAA